MLYSELAQYYDRIYHWKDYAADCAVMERLLRANKRSPGNRLLDIGCGTGGHIQLLQGRYECTGIDLQEEMLAIARAKVPKARFVQGDMRSFDLREKFDVVICMFSTIGYATTEQELWWTISNIANHLVPGGVAIIEPWLVKEDFRANWIGMHTYDGADAKIARMNESRIEDGLTIMDFHYLIGVPGRGVSHYQDRHVMGLFDLEVTQALMRRAGMEPSFDPKAFALERGALVGVRVAE